MPSFPAYNSFANKLLLFGTVDDPRSPVSTLSPNHTYPDPNNLPFKSGNPTGSQLPTNIIRNDFLNHNNTGITANGLSYTTVWQNTVSWCNANNGSVMWQIFYPHFDGSTTLAQLQSWAQSYATYMGQITNGYVLGIITNESLSGTPGASPPIGGNQIFNSISSFATYINTMRTAMPANVLLGMNEFNVADFSNYQGVGATPFCLQNAINCYQQLASAGAHLDWLGCEGYWWNNNPGSGNAISTFVPAINQFCSATGVPVIFTEWMPMKPSQGTTGDYTKCHDAWLNYVQALVANQYVFGIVGPWDGIRLSCIWPNPPYGDGNKNWMWNDTTSAAGGDPDLTGSVGSGAVTPTLNWIQGYVPSIMSTSGSGPPPPVVYTYPIKVSANSRYLIDSSATPQPWPLYCDAAWALLNKLNPTAQGSYFSTRASQGFTAIFVDLPTTTYIPGATPTDYAGNAAFSSAGNIATPNASYWNNAVAMVNLAATYNLVIIGNPADTGLAGMTASNSLMTWLRNAGNTGCFNYGVYLGNTFKALNNFFWNFGNDYQKESPFVQPQDDNLVKNLIQGIQSVDSTHIGTLEYVDGPSGVVPGGFAADGLSSTNALIYPLLQFNSAYTYFPAYATLFEALALTTVKPLAFNEGVYEAAAASSLTDAGTAQVIRKTAWWNATSGTCGQTYGHNNVFTFASGYASHLSDPGVTQLSYLIGFFSKLSWWLLLADTNQSFVTAGQGARFANLSKNTALNSIPPDPYVTSAVASDGSLAVVYCPVSTTITVNVTEMHGGSWCQWFDPTANTYFTIGAVGGSGTHNFTTPGNNASGNPDWVLLMQSALNQSANGATVLYPSTAALIDALGNSWTISSSQTVLQNGVAAGFSSNVTEIAYSNGVIWQMNSSFNWWSWSGTAWVAGSNPIESADGTVVLNNSGLAITDGGSNTWTLTSGVVYQNGMAAGGVSNGLKLSYVLHFVWLNKSDGSWWYWATSGWTSGPPESPSGSIVFNV